MIAVTGPKLAGAAAPCQLLMPSMLSGAGWGEMSASALYAIVSPWFVGTRPAALAMAYNGGSVGGVIFSPLWVKAIGTLRFSIAAAATSLVMVFTAGFLANHLFSRTPQHMGLSPDGDFPRTLMDARQRWASLRVPRRAIRYQASQKMLLLQIIA